MESAKPKKSLVRRILKWTGITLLVVILLLIIAPFLFKDKIVAIVKEQANKNLNAKVDFGDFDLSIISSFPDFRFKIQDVSVIGVDEFSGDTLAFIGALKTDINIKSVISGDKYQINSIIIDKPRIHGIVHKNGKANWDIAKPSADTTKAEEDTSATKFAMQLKEFKINDAYILYDDQQGNMYSLIEDLDYKLDGDFTQDIFVLKNLLEIERLTFKMGGIPYLNKVKTRVKADLDMNMPEKKYAFKENEFSLNDLTLGLDGVVMMPDTNIDMDLKFGTKKADFKSILSLIPGVYTKDFGSIIASGKFELNGHAKGRYNGSQMPAFGVNLAITNGMFKYPSLPKAVDNINVTIKVKNPTGVLDATTVDISRFHVEMAGNPLDVSAHISTPISDPGIRASIKGNINLASVKDIVPMEKSDNLSGIIKSDITIDGHMSAIDKKEFDKFKAQGALEIEQMDYRSATLAYPVKLNALKLNFTTQYVELGAFDALLGKSDIRASGRIDNLLQYLFKDDLIKGTFAVKSNLLDLNELMTSAGTSTAAATPSAPPSATASTGAAAVPANIDFNLDANFARVIYTNLDITNMVGNIVIRNQKVDMTNLRMNIIGGLLTVNGYYETTNIKKPGVGVSLKMDGFDIQTTFKTFVTMQKIAPIGQYAKGTFTATLENFKTTMNENMDPDLASVNAHGVFKTNQVNVGGFPPFVKLGEALKIEQLKNMEVKNVNAKYFIKDGRLNLEPFTTKINDINTTIEGSTGLDQTIDYKYKMEIPRAMFGSSANSALTGLMNQANAKAGTNMALGEKVNVNVGIGGTVTKPVVKTSLKEEAKSAVATVTTQAVNAAIDKANEEAQKILEDAKKECDRKKAESQAQADKTKQEGYAEADKLVEQAGNPIAKIAAKKAAEVAKKKVDEKVQKIVEDGDAKCLKLMEEAKAKADAKAAGNKK
jgi:hypothetical protein